MLHASQVLLVSLAINVVVLNILVFVYYGFYEITFLLLLLLLLYHYYYYMHIFKMGKTIKEKNIYQWNVKRRKAKQDIQNI